MSKEIDEIKRSSYFELRNAGEGFYDNFKLPFYLQEALPENKKSRIIDIGCGFGQMLNSIRAKGYDQILGLDISTEAVDFCKTIGIPVQLIDDIRNTVFSEEDKFDFAIMYHVVEHLEKKDVISVLDYIRSNILKPGGKILIAVPNAQSLSGTYWAYEDFTHNMLFTGGSIAYVLRAAGFKEITYLDIDGLSGSTGLKKVVKKMALSIYKRVYKILFQLTGATYHKPSPVVLTWEIKVLAS